MDCLERLQLIRQAPHALRRPTLGHDPAPEEGPRWLQARLRRPPVHVPARERRHRECVPGGSEGRRGMHVRRQGDGQEGAGWQEQGRPGKDREGDSGNVGPPLFAHPLRHVGLSEVVLPAD